MNRVVLTGTGVPVPDPARAGAGTLVDIDGVRLQIDAGRGTVLRLAGAMVPLPSIDAVLLTHHHSDHLVGLADLALTHFIPPPVDGYEPFVAEVRHGGFTGEVIAGDDLTTVSW